MFRLMRLWPLLLLIVLFLGLAGAAAPLVPRSSSLRTAFAPGNLEPEGPTPPDSARRLETQASSELSRSHSLQGTGMVILTWLLVPLAGVFPLLLAWKGIRRKTLAVLLTVAPLLFLLLLILAESFTGHFLGGLIRNPEGISQGRYLRFLALHSAGFPLLLVFTQAFLFWVQLRVARRAEPMPPEVPGAPQSST